MNSIATLAVTSLHLKATAPKSLANDGFLEDLGLEPRADACDFVTHVSPLQNLQSPECVQTQNVTRGGKEVMLKEVAQKKFLGKCLSKIRAT